MSILSTIESQLRKRPVLGVAVIAVAAIVVVSATGVLGKLTAPAARLFNWAKVKTGITPDARQAPRAPAPPILGAPVKRMVALFALFGGAALLDSLFGSGTPSGFVLAGLPLSPALWGFKRLASERNPLAGAAFSHAPQTVRFDVKDYLKNEVITFMLLRLTGTITKVGAAAGAATGRQNPDALLTNLSVRSQPAKGVISKNNLSARGLWLIGNLDRGAGINNAPLSDAAEAIAVDIRMTLRYRMPWAAKPIEFGLPLKAFDSYVVEATLGGRTELFTGGTPPTWDFTATTLELWADFEVGISGKFHLMEEFSQVIDVTQTRTDLPVRLDDGYIYTDLIFMAERDNVLVSDIINSIAIESAGRSWLPTGGANGPMFSRWMMELSNPSSLAAPPVGVYYIPAYRDGMISRALDMSKARPDIKLDVTVGGGTTRQIRVHGRRIVFQALQG